MQREIEIKVLDIIPEKLEQELIELGAEKIVEEKQVNYTFAPKILKTLTQAILG